MTRTTSRCAGRWRRGFPWNGPPGLWRRRFPGSGHHLEDDGAAVFGQLPVGLGQAGGSLPPGRPFRPWRGHFGDRLDHPVGAVVGRGGGGQGVAGGLRQQHLPSMARLRSRMRRSVNLQMVQSRLKAAVVRPLRRRRRSGRGGEIVFAVDAAHGVAHGEKGATRPGSGAGSSRRR